MNRLYFNGLIILLLSGIFFSCNKLQDYNQKPELEPIQQGLKTNAAIAYCASVAVSAYEGKTLPENVTYNKSNGLIYIHIDANHPLLFNKQEGDIIVAGLWNNNSGIISILFGDVDVLEGKIKIYGLYAVPLTRKQDDNRIEAVFIRQDIIMGYGSDTILQLGNITAPMLKIRLDRLEDPLPDDPFVAVKQNVWFIDIDQSGTSSNVYDDDLTISGGGQIAEVEGQTSGVVYHALIEARVNNSVCSHNPYSGKALSQNFKVGGSSFIDLGNSLLSFDEGCDGKAHVDFASGKYISYYGRDIYLGLP